jgi:putative hydrolase of the HAD superfamily
MTSSLFSKLPIVLFDLGGVLVHVRYSQFLEALGLDQGIDEERLLQLITPDGRLYETGKLTTEEFFSRLNNVLGGRYHTPKLHAAWKTILDGEVEGMRKVAEWVSQQTKVYLLSNTNDLHFTYSRGAFPALRFCTDYFVSFRIGAMKPDPEIYRHVMDSLRGDPQQLLFIDDLERNVEGARQVGLRSILFDGVEGLKRLLTNEGFSLD